MKYKVVRILAVVAVLAISAQGYSEGFEVEINDSGRSAKKDSINEANIVVTGTRSKKVLQLSPVRTEVVDRSKIEAKAATNLYDALNNELGVLVENNCQNCAVNTVRLNGLDGNYTQILFDGIGTVSSLAGVYLLQQMPAEMIERVEIVRGGGSALYGSGAIGGVVNVIRKKPTKNEGSVGFRYDWIAGNVDGNRDVVGMHTVSGNMSVVSDNGKAGIAMWGSKSDRNAWDANDDEYSDLPEDLNKSMGANGFITIIPGMELSFAGATFHTDRRGGNALGSEPFATEVNIAEAIETNRDTAEVRLDHEVSNMLNYTLYYAYAGTKRHTYYGPGGSDDLTEDTNLYGNTENGFHVSGLTVNIIPVAGHTFTVGAEYTSDKLIDSNPGMNRELTEKYDNIGLYAQYDWDMRFLEIVAGVRGDKHSALDDWEFSPRASLIFKFTPHIRWRNTVATGFKAPQVFDEDFHIEISLAGSGTTNHLIVNADNLEAEHSVSYSSDVSVDTHMGQLAMELILGGFYTSIEDAMSIDWGNGNTVGSNTYYTRSNADGTTKYYGGNLQLNVSYGSLLKLSSGWTYQVAEYENDESYDNGSFNEVPKVPELYGFSMLQLFWNGFQFAFSCQYMGKQYVVYEGTTTELRETDTFVVLNTRIEYKYNIDNQRYVTVFTGVDNITDAYQEDLPLGADRPAGYLYGPAKPLTIYAGARLGF
jgi:outer membrane receptor for ferrienterochelin and colicins